MKKIVFLLTLVLTIDLLQAQTMVPIDTLTGFTGGRSPLSMAFDKTNNCLYVANEFHSVISKIDLSGMGLITQSWATLAASADPVGIVADLSGNVYTANTVNGTISKVTSSGALTDPWVTLANGALPRGITIDGSGNIYTFNSNGSISKFNTSGTESQFQVEGSTSSLRAIIADRTGNVYVVIAPNGSSGGVIEKISFSGTNVSSPWSVPFSISSTTPNTFLGVAIDQANNVYLTYPNSDFGGRYLIGKVTSSGTATQNWALLQESPQAIVTDASGSVYVFTNSGTIDKITSSGTITAPWAQSISGATNTMAIDGSGNLYTAIAGGVGLHGVVNKIIANVVLPSATAASTQTIDNISPLVNFVQGNQLIATVSSDGANPVSGEVTASENTDNSIQTYNGQPYVQRHCDIEPSTNGSSASGTITVYYSQADFDAYNNYITTNGLSQSLLPTGSGDATGISNVLISQYHGVGTAPGNYSGSTVLINPDDDKILWNNVANRWEITFDITGFSGFYLSSNTGVLPVTLESFTGNLQNSIADLQWKTGTETNFNHFEIQKSTDSKTYTNIASIVVKGSDSYYTYSVPQAELADYYRLELVDNDGSSKYSNIIRLSQSENGVAFYPNPASTFITVTVAGAGYLSVYDADGKLIKMKYLQAGVNTIDIHELSRGAYYGIIGTKTVKFIKI